jgi:succinate-semialdehyde dehydrogenase/glutarate-semialdehyde dehydrogenase
VLYRHKAEVARLLSQETGKTLTESFLFEIVPVMHLTGYFAKRAGKILKPKKISISVFKNRASIIHHKPRGVVLVISPWNFPMSIPMGTVVMALLAGNAVILKPASLTPLTARKMRDLFDEAGLDPDLFQVVTGPGRLASQIIEDGSIDYVNFTGSTAVGRNVAQRCAAKFIPYSMELGGKDPAIVRADADLEKAARAIVWGAFANAGQVCASVERVYAHASVYDELVRRVVALTRQLRQQNPLDHPDTDVGSMTDPSQIEVIEKQLLDAVRGGARVLTGGKRAAAGSNFFEPTVVVDVDESMDIAREETFGPVVPIMKVSDDDEAIVRANQSRYGLNAYVFTRNAREGRRVADQLEAGTVMVNEVLMTHAFPETPWGGVKDSGVGFVHSDEGLKELTQPHHVNYALFSITNPAWYPYSEDKTQRFLAAAELVHRKNGISGKAKALWNLITGRGKPD